MEKKTNNLVVSIVCGILTAFGAIVSVISLVNGNGKSVLFFDVFSLALSMMVGYYALWGYKIPHGNLLKYIFLAYAIFVYAAIPITSKEDIVWRVVLQGIVVGSLCYTAGRLDKVKQNVVFLVLITALMTFCVIVDINSGDATIGIATGVVVWIDIFVAYFLRYREHKEAGLTDAPKK